MRTIAPLSCVSGIWQWSISNLALAVTTLQRQSLCKLSLVSFTCHFLYLVMQFTVSSCPKLLLLQILGKLSFVQYLLPLATVLDRSYLTYQGSLFGYSMSHRHHTDIQRPIILETVTAYQSLFSTGNQQLEPGLFYCFFVFCTIDLS